MQALKKSVQSVIKNKGEVTGSEDIFETVNNIVEFPTAILCNFDKKFLNLPQEIISTTTKKQKNFAVRDAKTKEVLTYFVGVKDGISTNCDTIKEGYEKVITARLEDAEFYFRNDTKTKLEDKVELLKGVVLQEKLGTIYDKILRIKKLSNWLLNNVKGRQNIDSSIVERICQLCKADLTTEMISEFPELQGTFGKICLLAEGENRIVADGVEQHWWPLNYDGKIPESNEASIVSIADKIDTIVGDFALGLVPTGSADPYGLRRAAFGIAKIAIVKELSFSIGELASYALSNLPTGQAGLPFETVDKNEVLEQVEAFIKQRLATYLKDNSILPDEIEAVLSTRENNILDLYNRALAIHAIRKLPDFEPIAVSFKRIGNILKQSEKAGLIFDGGLPDSGLFTEQQEKELYEKFQKAKENVEKVSLEGDYKQVLNEFVMLRTPVDNFFDKVLIMDKKEEIKINRLKLLYAIYNQFSSIADFSKIVTEK